MKKLRKILMLVITLIVLINQNVFANTVTAEWKFKVSANDTYSASDTLENLKLAETCDEKTLTNGTIAPGTRGSFSIVVEADELGAEYDVIFDNFSSNFPENFVFTVDGQVYDINTGFHNKLNGTDSFTHTVNWIWEYEGNDEYVERDVSEISFRITVTASQVNERAVRDVLPKTGF